jgi:hypothetical protein
LSGRKRRKTYIKYLNTESPKKAQHGKIEKVAGSV